jgi:hypothetical protein
MNDLAGSLAGVNDLQVRVLGLSKRPLGCLTRAGYTVGRLRSASDDELLNIPNFGVTCLEEVRERLQDFLDDYAAAAHSMDGVALADDPPEIVTNIRRLATIAVDHGVDSFASLVRLVRSPTPPPWLDLRLVESITSSPLAELADERLQDHFGWREAMRVTLARCSTTAQASVTETSTLRPDGGRTLQEIGTDCGVTRERIRQLKVTTGDELAQVPSIAAAAARLHGLLSPGCPLDALVAQGFDPASDDVLVLATVADRLYEFEQKPWSETVAGEEWRGVGPIPASWVRGTIADQPLSVSELGEKFGEFYPYAARSTAAALVNADDKLRVLGDLVVSWNGSLTDKAVIVLEHLGEPATTQTLVDFIRPESERSLINQLQFEGKHGGRLVKTAVDKRWALPHWDVEVHVGGENLMTQVIEEHGGQISLRRLTSLVVARGGFGETSVNMWATMSPRFVCEDGTVRCRRDDEPVPVPEPWQHASIVRRLDDPRPGSWSTQIRIDYDSIRVQSTSVPLPFAGLLGLQHGDTATLTCNGIAVAASWSMLSVNLHSSKGWREVCTTLGAVDGDTVVFSVADDSTAHAWVLADEHDDTPTGVIRSALGGAGTDHIITDVAWAVGFDGELDADYTLDDLDERLAVVRRDTTLRDALSVIHPELTS